MIMPMAQKKAENETAILRPRVSASFPTAREPIKAPAQSIETMVPWRVTLK